MLNNKIMFNNKDLPSFVKVKQIKSSILPDFEYTTRDIAYKDRTIEIDCTFKKKGFMDIEQQSEFIDFLSHSANEGELVIYNDETSYYKAKLDNNINVEGLKRGELTLVFKTRYYKEKFNTTVINDKVVTYNGQVELYPNLKCTITSACECIKIGFKNGKYNNYIELNGAFNKDEVIVINQESNFVTLNNLDRNSIWNLNSRRHKLVNGKNEYTKLIGNFNLEITYKERNF